MLQHCVRGPPRRIPHSFIGLRCSRDQMRSCCRLEVEVERLIELGLSAICLASHSLFSDIYASRTSRFYGDMALDG